MSHAVEKQTARRDLRRPYSTLRLQRFELAVFGMERRLTCSLFWYFTVNSGKDL